METAHCWAFQSPHLPAPAPAQAVAALLDGERAHARAGQLLADHGGVVGLSRQVGRRTPGLSEIERVRLHAGLSLGWYWLTTPPAQTRFAGPSQLAALGQRWLLCDTEVLVVVALDCGLRKLGEHVMGGSRSGVRATPADVLRPALALGAERIALIHNHPSGDPEPSDADLRFTSLVHRAAAVCGVALVDHVIVARQGWRSLRAEGALGHA
ncbi:MAG: hypothetical protein KC502_07165 [Myxococcales bacterium]|nr:hypothetical protein [Myxococcales bacterium]